MQRGTTLIIIGLATGIFGLIFHLQGQSIVGPESSFMYSNPKWTDYGFLMIIASIIISSVGFLVFRKN